MDVRACRTWVGSASIIVKFILTDSYSVQLVVEFSHILTAGVAL